MYADPHCPGSDLGGFDEWPSPEDSFKPDLVYRADVEWRDGPDEPFRCMKGIIFGLCMSLPLWGVIIGSGMVLFRV